MERVKKAKKEAGMDIGLKDKVAIVTGASRGIGAAIAVSLAEAGAKVVINYMKRKDKAEEVLAKVKEQGSDGFVFRADVTNKVEAEALVAETLKKFGKVDVLVCNAAINFPMRPFMNLSWEDVEAKFMGEMKALFHSSHAVVPDMMKRGSGRLIFISSGLSRYPSEAFFAHAAAKAGMDSGARVLAKELGPSGIKVNVIGPGLTDTDATSVLDRKVFDIYRELTPLKRTGVPDDIARVAVFLASDLSAFVTGQYIHVNGGFVMV